MHGHTTNEPTYMHDIYIHTGGSKIARCPGRKDRLHGYAHTNKTTYIHAYTYIHEAVKLLAVQRGATEGTSTRTETNKSTNTCTYIHTGGSKVTRCPGRSDRRHKYTA